MPATWTMSHATAGRAEPMIVRDESPADADRIRTMIGDAFRAVPHSSGNEVAIYDELRAAGAIVAGLVAGDDDDTIAGHLVLSAVTITGADERAGDRWLGVGPVAVGPDRQRRGIGTALMNAAIIRASRFGAAGLVLVGNPAFYGRFGFAARDGLTYGAMPSRFVLGRSLTQPIPAGMIRFHAAFEAR